VTLVDPAAQTGALALVNSTSGVGITQLCLDLVTMTDELEPRLPAEWLPSPVDPDLLALTGLWHWGPTPYHLRVQGDGLLRLAPVDGVGRGSRFRATGKDTYIGLDAYYAGETLEVGRNADGVATHLDLATFVFTRTPYDPAAPVPGGVEDWR
jgi:hypothetical protein